MNCILLYTFDRIKLALNLIQLHTVFYLRYYQEIPSNSFGITKYGIGRSQSVALCQSQNYFVNLHLEIVSPNGDYQKHVICQVPKNKIWPWSVIHG